MVKMHANEMEDI